MFLGMVCSITDPAFHTSHDRYSRSESTLRWLYRIFCWLRTIFHWDGLKTHASKFVCLALMKGNFFLFVSCSPFLNNTVLPKMSYFEGWQINLSSLKKGNSVSDIELMKVFGLFSGQIKRLAKAFRILLRSSTQERKAY